MRLRGPACNNTIIPKRLAFTHWFFETTSATTDDVLDECEPERECGDTPLTYTCMKKYYIQILCITVVSGCRTKITVVSGYRTNNYRGFWLPYRNYRGGQLPCKNYCALPWSLVTVQTLPWWPVTVIKLLRITAVAGYRGKRYRDEKSLPREALKMS